MSRVRGRGWVTAECGTTAGNRRARYYELTKTGRRQLDTGLASFTRVSDAIARVLQTA